MARALWLEKSVLATDADVCGQWGGKGIQWQTTLTVQKSGSGDFMKSKFSGLTPLLFT